jgi:hypothetical protein
MTKRNWNHRVSLTRGRGDSKTDRSKSTSKGKSRARPKCINHTFKLYEKKETNLSRIPSDEREFFHEWVRTRRLEDQYLLLALTYWMRIRGELSIYLLVRDKRIYMILCIHIALKWLGYDEVYKCNFINDLREIGSVTPNDHAELEMEVLRCLSWDLS